MTSFSPTGGLFAGDADEDIQYHTHGRDEDVQYHTHGHQDPEPEEPNHPRSPLHSLFNRLTSDIKTKANGEPLKRRGPKPNSKPAVTRRQELNRTAQRTHRERKELYVKALEEEVLRLKDTYKKTTQERDAYAQENRKLRELLSTYGINIPPIASRFQDPSSSGSISGSYPPPSASKSRSPPPLYPPNVNHLPNVGANHGPSMNNLDQMIPGADVDYASVGFEFVNTYDRLLYPSPPPNF